VLLCYDYRFSLLKR